MTRQARAPRGAVVAMGDNSPIDARTYNLTITVEQRVELLHEVGAALRPVLEAMSARIAHLEHENLLLRDTIESVASARLGPVTTLGPSTGAGSALAQRDTTPAVTTCDVGTRLVEPTHADSWPATTLRSVSSWGEASLLEELRYG